MSVATRSAIVLGLAWMGDALIYIVMPLHAAAFGIGLPWVGVVLSVNRIVRILGYGWIDAANRRVGGRVLVAAAGAVAAVSTVMYGVVSGVALLLVARLLWGLCYGTLNILTTVYAIGDGAATGTRIGATRAVAMAGPTLAVAVGPLLAVWLGPRDVFVVLGVVGFLALPLALGLPPLREVGTEAPAPGRSRWRPSTLNLLFFAVSFAIDGVFTMTLSLLLAKHFSVGGALIGAGLVLTVSRSVTLLGSLGGGPIVDRFGARRILPIAVVTLFAGLVIVATGWVVLATALIIPARALLTVVGPVLVAAQPGNRVERMAAFSTWVDCGLAAGPLLAGVLFEPLGAAGMYMVVAAIVAVTLVAHLVAERGAVPAAATVAGPR